MLRIDKSSKKLLPLMIEIRDALFAPAIFRHSEQEMVDEYLGPARGVFVDVGANDPFRGSQSFLLEQRGWTGILVEPLAEKAMALRNHRKGTVFEAACGPPELHGSQATLHVQNQHSTLTIEGGDPGVKFLEQRIVSVQTLNSMLAAAGITRCDLLSVDVEGFELEVIRGTDLAVLQPRLILIEDKGRSLNLHRYLKVAGYKRVRRTDLNSWYVPSEVPFPVSLVGRIQFFRKFYLAMPLRKLKVWNKFRHAS